jgi:uncharacterized protein (TIGR03437 family)
MEHQFFDPKMTHRYAPLLALLLPLAGAVNYSYDPAGRLTKVDYGNGTVITYTYDKAGNLLSRTVGSGAGPSVNAVVNGASFASGGIAPGEIATIFGANLTSSGGINLTSGLPLPTKFLDTSVLVNGSPAPLFAIDNVNGQEQINFQVPWEVAAKPNATISVVNNGVSSPGVAVPVLAAQPGIISYAAAGGNFGVILHANFQLADAAHPATAGEVVLIYCTGLGAVSSTPADGAPASGQTTKVAPTVTIGGQKGAVSFSGLAPGFVGLNQVNVQVPSGTKSGNQMVVITVGGASSNAVLLPVK